MILNRHILKYIFITIISLVFLCSKIPIYAQETSDSLKTTSVKTDTTIAVKIKKIDYYNHFNIGVDIFQPILNHLEQSKEQYKEGYEIATDFYLKRELFLAVEGGWGSSLINYPDLKYKTKNNYIRIGLNRYILVRRDSTDWDNMFIGFRLAAASLKRGNASYAIVDTPWGYNYGTLPDRTITPIWLELTMGVKVQLVKNLIAGWNIRSKFMLNQKSFLDLTPQYIAGYGSGDKNAVFDINFYLQYGIMWKRKVYN